MKAERDEHSNVVTPEKVRRGAYFDFCGTSFVLPVLSVDCRSLWFVLFLSL